jgi:hypothetical protein
MIEYVYIVGIIIFLGFYAYKGIVYISQKFKANINIDLPLKSYLSGDDLNGYLKIKSSKDFKCYSINISLKGYLHGSRYNKPTVVFSKEHRIEEVINFKKDVEKKFNFNFQLPYLNEINTRPDIWRIEIKTDTEGLDIKEYFDFKFHFLNSKDDPKLMIKKEFFSRIIVKKNLPFTIFMILFFGILIYLALFEGVDLNKHWLIIIIAAIGFGLLTLLLRKLIFSDKDLDLSKDYNQQNLNMDQIRLKAEKNQKFVIRKVSGKWELIVLAVVVIVAIIFSIFLVTIN